MPFTFFFVFVYERMKSGRLSVELQAFEYIINQTNNLLISVLKEEWNVVKPSKFNWLYSHV